MGKSFGSLLLVSASQNLDFFRMKGEDTLRLRNPYSEEQMSRLREQHLSLAMRSEVCFVAFNASSFEVE